MCSDCSFPCVADRGPASCPGLCHLDRALGSIVRTARVKQRQHVSGTICRPSRQETVFGEIKRATAMHCNKTPVAHIQEIVKVLQFTSNQKSL